MHDAKQIAEYICANDGYAVVCHENPDGDALGSLLAMTRSLQKMGKEAVAVCADPVPYKYKRLAGMELIQPAGAAAGFSHMITVDCAQQDRVGAEVCRVMADAYTINIDHHQSNTSISDMNYIGRASSCAELVYEVVQAMGVPLDAELAGYLLLGVSTDTGNFSYANTNADTLRFAAALLDAGADLHTMCNDIYKRRSMCATRLVGRAIGSIELRQNGRVAMMTLAEKDFIDCEANTGDTEGLIDYARDIDTVEVAVMLREVSGGVKGSMRSKGGVDVSRLAAKVGGGGHHGAAGFVLQGTGLEIAKQNVWKMLEDI